MKKWEWNQGDVGCLLFPIPFIIISGLAAVAVPLLGLLRQSRWVPLYWLGIGLSILGFGLLFAARLPLYRERRFWTWGPRTLPTESRVYYRWAYRLILPGAVSLVLFLVLAKN